MKKILFLGVLILLVLPMVLNAEDADPGIRVPVQAAKEYIAEKYGCDINDLTVGDTFIGSGAAHIDVGRGYETERVTLSYNDTDQRWKAESSELLHQY